MEGLHPEHQSNPEQEAARALEALPEALGYVETEEMVGLGQEWVAAMVAGENTKEFVVRYELLADELNTSTRSEPAGRMRLGRLVRIAILRRDGGRYDDYIGDLWDAHDVAEYEGFEDARLVIGAVLGIG